MRGVRSPPALPKNLSLPNLHSQHDTEAARAYDREVDRWLRRLMVGIYLPAGSPAPPGSLRWERPEKPPLGRSSQLWCAFCPIGTTCAIDADGQVIVKSIQFFKEQALSYIEGTSGVEFLGVRRS
eukprot:Skav214095  [mRNA]  locus=scaffold1185:131289:132679:- [translate_table: standard]